MMRGLGLRRSITRGINLAQGGRFSLFSAPSASLVLFPSSNSSTCRIEFRTAAISVAVRGFSGEASTTAEPITNPNLIPVAKTAPALTITPTTTASSTSTTPTTYSSPSALFDHKAMAPAYETAASIIRNVTEMQLTKMLHVYCDSAGLVEHLGQARYLDMSGCSDDELAVNAAKSMKEYTQALHVPDLTQPPLPFRTRSFQFITCLLPHMAVHLKVNLEEISRMLSSSGFALVGMPTGVFETHNVMGLLEAMQNDQFVELLMMQRLGIQTLASTRTEDDNYTLFLIRALT